ncbi:Hypothetical predicted protein [Olea europaea subsp. europaea]|uniref:Uncharacterized protein n=1 Tax=Olea europaea subsp. europaea TaxID=158383 RepID=A0A8S0PZ57_OLEEU|nr:Hypothetical predicted protein [Olea europaea subsp. europaea]
MRRGKWRSEVVVVEVGERRRCETEKIDRPSESHQRNARSPQVGKRNRDETLKTSTESRRRKSNNIEVRYVVPSDDEIVAPNIKRILYKKPLQPHVREDMQFGDTGDAGMSVPVQSHTPRPRLLMITGGCKGHSSDVEDDDDDDFVDTPSKGKKTHFHFHSPTEEHTTWEYYLTEPEGHDIHTSPQT